MQIAGLAVRDVVGVMREARTGAAASARISVAGILASELVRALSEGARPGSVQVGGDVAGASALLVVLAGAPSEQDETRMRAAARARVPLVAVQTDARVDAAIPYVLPGAVVVCPPGRGFPVDAIAGALVDQLGHDAVPVAAAVPALRGTVVRGLVRNAAARAAVVGALPLRRATTPVLTMVQARLVLDLAAAHGRAVDQERAPELAAVAGTGLGLRSLVRSVPVRLPLVGGLTGYLATRAIGEAAIRRFALEDAEGSVRSRS